MRRASIVAVAAMAATVMIPATPPVEVAADSCTGWTSRRQPPRTVRVLLTRSDRVVKVRFRTYVARVMASGEWPSRLPRALLAAGGFAAKQYAWYHALKGNHRPWYRNAQGQCYDVRNDTNDQLYAKGADPTRRQFRALDRLWLTSLRRKDRFILTGYRASGFSGICARDADGWRLYARSAHHCARKDLNAKRILRAYYGRWRVDFVRPRRAS
jgi:hypothetical protein